MTYKLNYKAIFEDMQFQLVEQFKLEAPVHDADLRKSISSDVTGDKVTGAILNIYMISYWAPVEFGCFFGDSRKYNILTKRGFRALRKVKIGDEVLTHKKRWKKVIDKPIHKVEYKIPRYTIELQSGKKVTVTEEHPFYCKRNNKFVWVKAKNLKEKDVLVEVE